MRTFVIAMAIVIGALIIANSKQKPKYVPDPATSLQNDPGWQMLMTRRSRPEVNITIDNDRWHH